MNKEQRITQESILGSLILNGKYFFEFSQVISTELFTDNDLAVLFECIKGYYAKTERIDLAILSSEVSKKTNLSYDEISRFVSSSNPEKINEQISLLREAKDLIELDLIITQARTLLNCGTDSIKILDGINNGITDLLKKSNDSPGHISEYIRDSLDLIYKAKDCSGLSGIDTGIKKLNDLTGGFQPTDLVILGARPGLGKTTLALNYILSAVEKGIPSVLYSLEMSSTQILHTIVNIKTGISVEHMRSGHLNDQDTSTIESCMEEISNLPLFILDNKRTFSAISASARFLKRKYNIQLMLIDYLQLISSESKGQNRNSQVEQISRNIKLLASSGDCNLTAVVLSQLNRSVESRVDKRPLLSDLRESGAIEQDADMVQFLYRDSYYSRNQEDNSVELIIAKNRHGRLGTIHLKYKDRIYLNTENYNQEYNYQDKRTDVKIAKIASNEEELIF